MAITRRGFVKTFFGVVVGTAVVGRFSPVAAAPQGSYRKFRVGCGTVTNVDLKKYYR